MRWFGESPFSRACLDVNVNRCPTPVGARCGRCEEPIAAGDAGYEMPHFGEDGAVMLNYHAECYLRGVIGGLNHLMGSCTCCGGTEPPDPPGMTKREAARAACAFWGIGVPRRP